jgi:hypothetical protein
MADRAADNILIASTNFSSQEFEERHNAILKSVLDDVVMASKL